MANGQQLGVFGELIAQGFERRQNKRYDEFVSSFLDYLSNKMNDTTYNERQMTQDIINANLMNDQRVLAYVQLFKNKQQQQQQWEQEAQQSRDVLQYLGKTPENERDLIDAALYKGVETGAIKFDKAIDIHLKNLEAKNKERREAMTSVLKFQTEQRGKSQLPKLTRDGQDIPLNQQAIKDFYGGKTGFEYFDKPTPTTRVINLSQREWQNAEQAKQQNELKMQQQKQRTSQNEIKTLNSNLSSLIKAKQALLKTRSEAYKDESPEIIKVINKQISDLDLLIDQYSNSLQRNVGEQTGVTVEKPSGDVGAIPKKIKKFKLINKE